MRFYALGLLLSLVFGGWAFDYQITATSTEDERTVKIAPVGFRLFQPAEVPLPGTDINEEDDEEPTP
jgi:hypothetical protein